MATAAETGISTAFRVVESSVGKEQVSLGKDEISENSADSEQVSRSKYEISVNSTDSEQVSRSKDEISVNSADSEQVSVGKDEISENSADSEQIPNERPPRHLSVVLRRINSPTDTGAVGLVSEASFESLTYM